MKFQPNKKYDLILFGRVAIDFNPVDCFQPLDKCTTFNMYLGGSPANTAVGMARLGRKVGFCAKISNDKFGHFVYNFFKEEGIDTSHLVRATGAENTGLTFTEILSKDVSSILMYRNQAVDLALSPDDIDEEYIVQAKAILISGTALAASPSREACLKGVMLAEKNGIPIIFDIDYRNYTWKNKDEISIYYSLIAEKSAIIMGSSEEFTLTGRLWGVGETDSEISSHWLDKKAQIVVVKHGKQGSNVYVKGEGGYKVDIIPVDAIKTFGGGDGYASAFLSGLFENKPIKECLEMATASASMLVASHACSKDMPDAEKLTEFISLAKKKGEFVKKL